jgi:uncharacterized protein (TIGR00255 family)
MTGFGSASGEVQGWSCRLEIRTLNNRFKEFVVRSPHVFSRYEAQVKKLIASRVKRGRIEIWVQMEDPQKTAAGVSVNLEAARGVLALLRHLQKELELPGEITLDHLLPFNVVTQSKTDDAEAELPVSDVLALAGKAVDQLMIMRENEGHAMAEDLAGRLTFLTARLEALKKLAVTAPLAATKRYQARLEELAETLLDPARLGQEAAILAEKVDITEEITRFGSHLQAFGRLLDDDDEPVGRRLEFLLQEMSREVNTMGSKSQAKSITDLVLEFKSELEKIREQALNIE